MTDVVLHPAESPHGALQRGRGCAARQAVREPCARELVHDCVRNDPRWDPLDARGLYYARLILDLELDTGPVARHLFDPRDHTDTDEDRTGLAIDVLARLVRLGRVDAVAPLRRYAREGSNWYAALQALVELDDPDLTDGLDRVAAARCDDTELARLGEGAITRAWAARHPRIAAARRPDLRPHEPRAPLTGHGDATLAACARSRGPIATAAILELGRRRSALVLDLVEELLSHYEGPLCRAVRDLGAGALERARRWATAECAYRDLGIDVLAAHGDGSDVPLLLNALQEALHDEDWDVAAVPAEGLGRLRCRAAIQPLMRGWAESAGSRLRMTVLTALLEIDPHIAEPYLVEGLWDCEPGVRRIAAGAAPPGRETWSRLHRLRREIAEDPHVRAAAEVRLLTSGPAEL